MVSDSSSDLLLLAITGVCSYLLARTHYHGLYIEAARTREAELRRAKAEAKQEREAALNDAASESRRVLAEAKAQAARELERVEREARDEIETARERARAREDSAAAKEAVLQERERSIDQTRATVEQLEREARVHEDTRRRELEAVAGLSSNDAREQLLSETRTRIRQELAREVRQLEESTRREADRKATRVLSIAMQRLAADVTHDRTTTIVHLPSEDYKGRIIGREGRNIRALQEACGVDFVIDDTPEVLQLSGFDPVRREVARVALEALIEDGRIHPASIEEAVEAARRGVDGRNQELAQAAADELGVGELPGELARLLGSLRFRYSHGQNVLEHAKECAALAGMMAAELGENETLARRAGLLHDIGRAVDESADGPHAIVGARVARRHGEASVVVGAIASHHEDEPPASVIADLVICANVISEKRPGARKETLQGHVKRLEELEKVAKKFAGVERAYALQAGREVRVIVEPKSVSDDDTALLAREIAQKIEQELDYPGQVRVTVVREVRATEYAKRS